jgi:S1-C subfamily serine protease
MFITYGLNKLLANRKRLSYIEGEVITMKLIPILLTALMLTGCAVADAGDSAPENNGVKITTVAAIVEPEKVEITGEQIEELKKSCVTIYADFGDNWSQGTAVAVESNKYLTAYHAAQEHFTNIRTKDGIQFTLGTFDADLDIATLISSKEAIPVKIGDSRDSRVGDEVIIIGSPGGKDDTVIRTTIKRLGSIIVVNGSAGGGSSGGGMFNMKGELIGIVVGGNVPEDETHAVSLNKINRAL